MGTRKMIELPGFVEDQNGDFVPHGHPSYSALLDHKAAHTLLDWLDTYGGHLRQRGLDKAVSQIKLNAKVIANLVASRLDD